MAPWPVLGAGSGWDNRRLIPVFPSKQASLFRERRRLPSSGRPRRKNHKVSSPTGAGPWGSAFRVDVSSRSCPSATGSNLRVCPHGRPTLVAHLSIDGGFWVGTAARNCRGLFRTPSSLLAPRQRSTISRVPRRTATCVRPTRAFWRVRWSLLRQEELLAYFSLILWPYSPLNL